MIVPSSPRVVNVPITATTTTTNNNNVNEQVGQEHPQPQVKCVYSFDPLSPHSFDRSFNNNNNHISPQQWSGDVSPPALRPRAHTTEDYHHHHRHRENCYNNIPEYGRLPLTPCLDDLGVPTSSGFHQQQQHQQQQHQIHQPLQVYPQQGPVQVSSAKPSLSLPSRPQQQQTALQDDASTVSSISNTSWERYQKLKDRYGWCPPSPEVADLPFVAPEFICIVVRARATKYNPKNDAEASEIPDWLRDNNNNNNTTANTTTMTLSSTTTPKTSRRVRAQTSPSVLALAQKAMAIEDTMPDKSEYGMQQPQAHPYYYCSRNHVVVPPEHDKNVHPLFRKTTAPVDPANRPPRDQGRRRHHQRGASDHFVTMLGRNKRRQRQQQQQDQEENEYHTNAFDFADLSGALVPQLDVTSITSANDDDDDDNENGNNDIVKECNNPKELILPTTFLSDNDYEYNYNYDDNDDDDSTNRAHWNTPAAFLWDKCVKAPVQKVLQGGAAAVAAGSHAAHHRRSKSYDFKASPSATLT